jgi:hypothetical protein
MRELDQMKEGHSINMKRMAVLGRKKVKTIETIEKHIKQV